ncbi:hypothetical protein [Rubripirellula obstinata]|nr:hypothetical protein [Rubripirellula obstinata]
MSDIEDDAFRSFFGLVQEIATHHPRKKRRWKWLQKNKPDLLDRIRHNEHFDWLLDEDESMEIWDPDEIDPANSIDQINESFTEIAHDDQEENDMNF